MVAKKVFFWNQVPGWIQLKTDQLPHQLQTLGVAMIFFLYYFCCFKYSPLVNWITNCTLKSIPAQSERFNCFLHVYIQRTCMHGLLRAALMHSTFFLWTTSATQCPWICTTAFLQLDAFSQRVRLYIDIPEMHQRKTDHLRTCGRGLTSSKNCQQTWIKLYTYGGRGWKGGENRSMTA